MFVNLVTAIVNLSSSNLRGILNGFRILSPFIGYGHGRIAMRINSRMVAGSGGYFRNHVSATTGEGLGRWIPWTGSKENQQAELAGCLRG
jgi:hypothetical protein